MARCHAQSLAAKTTADIYFLGHAEVRAIGNEQAERLTSTTDTTIELQLDMTEMLRDLRNFLNMNGPEHHSIDRTENRDVGTGGGRPLSRGRPWGDS